MKNKYYYPKEKRKHNMHKLRSTTKDYLITKTGKVTSTNQPTPQDIQAVLCEQCLLMNNKTKRE